MACQESDPIPAYQLSSELVGHSGDVRAVTSLVDRDGKVEYVVTASRDCTVLLWSRPFGAREFTTRKTLAVHGGYVCALCIVPADPALGREHPLIASAGQDRTLFLHSLHGETQEPVAKYVGHTGLISSIIYQNQQLVTCSWDSTIRVWKDSGQSDCMIAHKSAAWSLSGLFPFDGTDRVLSGGADRVIRLWELSTRLCVQEYDGHGDVVRSVCVISQELFLSASNDCTIRKWSIHSGQCLREFHGHEAFIYSLASLQSPAEEDFCTSGEDGTLRVWKGGNCDQVIRLPCISVWTVCCSSNGDIITGSSDGIARVFTRNQALMANRESLQEFESQVTQHTKSKGSGIDISSLPGVEALRRPGKRDGETKLINNNETAEIYQWEADKGMWTKLGDAIGQVPEAENFYQGKEYDYVFDIEVDDGGPKLRKLKLPYNKSEDPFLAAQRFLDTNSIPLHQLDQVAQFIMRNTGAIATPMSLLGAGDPLTGENRYIPGGPSQHLPTTVSEEKESPRPLDASKKKNVYFPMERLHSFQSPSDFAAKILRKLREFGDTVTECHLQASQWTSIESLCAALSSSSPLKSLGCQILLNLMDWPAVNLFPVLDLVRLAVLNEGGHEYFVKEGTLCTKVLVLASLPDAMTRNQVLLMRVLVNLFSHDSGRQWMLTHAQKVLSVTGNLFVSNDKNLQVATATIVMNYCHSLCLQAMNKESLSQAVLVAIKVLRDSSVNVEAKFRMLIALGTLCQVNKKALLSVVSVEELHDILLPLCDVTDPEKVSQCTLHILEML